MHDFGMSCKILQDLVKILLNFLTGTNQYNIIFIYICTMPHLWHVGLSLAMHQWSCGIILCWRAWFRRYHVSWEDRSTSHALINHTWSSPHHFHFFSLLAVSSYTYIPGQPHQWTVVDNQKWPSISWKIYDTIIFENIVWTTLYCKWDCIKHQSIMHGDLWPLSIAMCLSIISLV